MILSPEQGARPDWTQCSFIEGARDADGRLAHVIFATQSIHDAKARELEVQRKLRQTNEELTALLAVDRMFGCEDGYYDIVFMDIQMPRMNGYDAARAIRAMDRNYCKQVPIVAMTANAFAEDVQAAKTVGMNEHIAKPLELNALTKTLNKWLRR